MYFRMRVSGMLLAGLFLLAARASGELCYIPETTAVFGDPSWADERCGFSDEGPLFTNMVPHFYLEATEVSKGGWDEVRLWGRTNGYADLAVGMSGTTNDPLHPVVDISWYDAVKWCNARSEKEGLAPVYYSDAGTSVVYRAGQTDLSSACADWAAAGYRLPTEREWETAARGSLADNDYPWPDTSVYYRENITAGQANVAGEGSRETAAYPANGWGLYDMAGNVSEWCWDWYDARHYIVCATNAAAAVAGPDGPSLEACRIARGGSWLSDARDARCSARDMARPADRNLYQGFRCARSFSATTLLDTDHDRMPDWWEYDYWHSITGAVFADDADRDGLSNGDEWLCGSDPVNPDSKGFVFELAPSDSRNMLAWPSRAGCVYGILYSDNLLDGFTILATNLPATPPVNFYPDEMMSTGRCVFYRVWVE